MRSLSLQGSYALFFLDFFLLSKIRPSRPQHVTKWYLLCTASDLLTRFYFLFYFYVRMDVDTAAVDDGPEQGTEQRVLEARRSRLRSLVGDRRGGRVERPPAQPHLRQPGGGMTRLLVVLAAVHNYYVICTYIQ